MTGGDYLTQLGIAVLSGGGEGTRTNPINLE